MTSTWRVRCKSETGAPSSKPRASRRSSPARHPGAAASKGRHKARACTWTADRATGVSRPALSSRVRHGASFEPRASVPASFLTTPLHSDVPVSRGPSTWVVARMRLRLPRPQRASCNSDPPTCWLYQPVNCAATWWARASASACSTACLTAQREARSRTLTATLGSCAGLGTGWLRSAGCYIWTTSLRTTSPLKS
jgi:hypothetical protein